eukprot:TRINITY_DN7371_c0_g1_i2.p1 TRINITY_DN7371_c0_g1~~TRINITY_DN7371_c0_g1_i2.p1  ORF type:complete len:1007 (-),score=134.57 TRINITY_DN7371_c0_g1_i2:2151-5171(-)
MTARTALIFGRLGRLLASRPLPILGVWLAAYVLLSLGFLRAKTETRLEHLWVESGTRLIEEKEFYEEHWGGLDRTLLLLFRATDTAGGADLLRADRLAAILELHGHFLNHSDDYLGLQPTYLLPNAITAEWGGHRWGLREFCQEPPLPALPFRLSCITMTPLACYREGEIDSNGMSQIDRKTFAPNWIPNHPYSLKHSAQAYLAPAQPCYMWGGVPIEKGATIGDVTWAAVGNGTSPRPLARAGVFGFLLPMLHPASFVRKWAYLRTHTAYNTTAWQGHVDYLEEYPKSITEDEALQIMEKWESRVTEFLNGKRKEFQKSEMDLLWWHDTALQEVIDDATAARVSSLIVSCVLMVAYVVLCLAGTGVLSQLRSGSRKETGTALRAVLHSHVLLSLGTVACMCLAVSAAMGFASLCGLRWNMITLNVLPFLALGLGIDEAFIVFFSLEPDRICSEEQLALRLESCFRHIGPSITLTSLANGVAFFVGIFIPLPAIQTFAVQALIAVLTNYLAVIFLFTPLLVLDVRRILAARLDVVLIQVATVASAVAPEADAEASTRVKIAEDNSDESGGRVTSEHPGWLVTGVTWLVSHPVPRFGLPMLAVALLGVSLWGCTIVQPGLKWSDFTTEGTMAHEFLATRFQYLDTDGSYIIARGLNYTDASTQLKLNDLLNRYSALPHVPSPVTATAWWSYFWEWSVKIGKRCYDPDTKVIRTARFYLCLSEWLEIEGAAFAGDLVLTRSASGDVVNISASRMAAFNRPTSHTPDVLQTIRETRALLDASGLPLYAYGFSYQYNEQYLHIVKHTIRLLIAAVFAIGGVTVTLLLVASPDSTRPSLVERLVVSALVLAVVAAMCVEAFAVMAALDMPLNSVALLNVLSGVGLFVEFSAHVAAAFVDLQRFPDLSPAQRAASALREVCIPTLHGAATNFVSIVVIAGTPIRFFRMYFFLSYVLMILIGLFHGLVVLPTLFALFPSRPQRAAVATLPVVQPVQTVVAQRSDTSARSTTPS